MQTLPNAEEIIARDRSTGFMPNSRAYPNRELRRLRERTTRTCGAPRRLRRPSAQEQPTQQAARERRLQRSQQVQALHTQGLPILQIARRLRMSRGTIRVYAAATTFLERAAHRTQPSELAPYLPFLPERWQAGCTNAHQLWRDIQAQGYPAGPQQVARWAQYQRTEPAASTPTKYRRRAMGGGSLARHDAQAGPPSPNPANSCGSCSNRCPT